MSLYDYRVSNDIAARNYPIHALIMAAMRKADLANAARLRQAWPETWDEWRARDDAPGGVLPEDLPRSGAT